MREWPLCCVTRATLEGNMESQGELCSHLWKLRKTLMWALGALDWSAEGCPHRSLCLWDIHFSACAPASLRPHTHGLSPSQAWESLKTDQWTWPLCCHLPFLTLLYPHRSLPGTHFFQRPLGKTLSANLSSSTFSIHPELATAHHLCYHHPDLGHYFFLKKKNLFWLCGIFVAAQAFFQFWCQGATL